MLLGACQDSPTSGVAPDDPQFVEAVRLPGLTADAGDCTQTGWTRNEQGVCEAPPPPTNDPTDTEDPASDDPGGGGGEDGDGPNSAPEDAYDDGPILWGACILGMVGSTMAVADVADKFKSWHAAYKDAEGAYRLWQATVENNAPVLTQQFQEAEYKHARQRQEDAKGDISNLTRQSGFTLAAAALTCGALALVPTP